MRTQILATVIVGFATGLCACLLTWAAGWPFEAYIAVKLGGMALGGTAAWWFMEDTGVS